MLRTAEDVGRLGPRHLDSRRTLLPASYLEHPEAFGRRREVRIVLPVGGDRVSQQIALLQHRLILAWNERGRRPSAAELASSWCVSKQVISRCALGQRWLGETLLAAFLQAVAAPPAPPSPPPASALPRRRGTVDAGLRPGRAERTNR